MAISYYSQRLEVVNSRRQESRKVTLRERLKTIRAEKGWTQKDLARESDVHWNSVARWEAGQRSEMSLREAIKVGHAAGVNPYWLTGESEQREPSPAAGMDGALRAAGLDPSSPADAAKVQAAFLQSLVESGVPRAQAAQAVARAAANVAGASARPEGAPAIPDRPPWVEELAAGLDAVRKSADATATAVEFQRQTFVDAVRQQREDYNRKIDRLTDAIERLTSAVERGGAVGPGKRRTAS